MLSLVFFFLLTDKSMVTEYFFGKYDVTWLDLLTNCYTLTQLKRFFFNTVHFLTSDDNKLGKCVINRHIFSHIVFFFPTLLASSKTNRLANRQICSLQTAFSTEYFGSVYAFRMICIIPLVIRSLKQCMCK